MSAKKSTKKHVLASDELSKDKVKKWLSNPSTLIIIDSDDTSDTARSGSPYSYDRKNGILRIYTTNIDDLDSDLKEVFLSVIRTTHEEGYLIYKESKVDEINSYKEYVNSKNNNNVILTFFKDIIPLDDYFALKTSLYIEYLAKKGINIFYHKKDLRDRFGKRGANIANLCSANYFRDVFMPLYNDGGKDSFKEYYELAVAKSAIALFVNAHMDVSEIKFEVDDMVAKAIKYGLEDFHVHGKGYKNVSNIKDFVNKINPSEDGYIARKEYEDLENNVIDFIIELV